MRLNPYVRALAQSTSPTAAALPPFSNRAEMLTVLRDPRNIEQLRPFLPTPMEAPPRPVLVAGLPILEQGPLAGGIAGGLEKDCHRQLACSG
jgi:hypothetical protein